MLPKIKIEFDKLEYQRDAVINGLHELTHEQLNYKPAPDSWSILQVLNHLIHSERKTVDYIQKKIQDVGNLQKAGARAAFSSFMLDTILRLPLKFKAPQVALPVQNEMYSLDEMQREWVDVRERFAQVLNKLDPISSEKLIFKHPRAGRFNIYQTLSFISGHVEHHRKQIARVKASPGFPKSVVNA